MTALKVTVQLKFDVQHPSLPRYQSLDGLTRKDFRVAFEQRIFGSKAAAARALMAKTGVGATWKLTIEDDQASGHPLHTTVKSVANTALDELNKLGAPAQLKILANGTQAAGTHGTMAATTPGEPPYHCVNWVYRDGKWVAIYNYALAIVTQSGEVDEVILDNVTSLDPVKAGIHLAVEYTPE